MNSVTLNPNNFKAILKMTTRLQIAVYIILLSMLDKGPATGYIEAAEEITGHRQSTIIHVLEMLIWDGHIEKVGGPDAKLGECPIRLGKKK